MDLALEKTEHCLLCVSPLMQTVSTEGGVLWSIWVLSAFLPGSRPCCNDLHSIFHSWSKVLHWTWRKTGMASKDQGPSQSLSARGLKKFRKEKNGIHFSEENVCCRCVEVFLNKKLSFRSGEILSLDFGVFISLSFTYWLSLTQICFYVVTSVGFPTLLSSTVQTRRWAVVSTKKYN